MRVSNNENCYGVCWLGCVEVLVNVVVFGNGNVKKILLFGSMGLIGM